MPHSHSVDNCSLRYYRKDRQLDFGKSRSSTQFSQQNLQPASRRFWAYVCAFGPGLMAMMAMMEMMMMVMVMVMVPKVLSQVGWLRQHQRQSFHRLKAFYWPKLPDTQSFQSAQRFFWKRCPSQARLRNTLSIRLSIRLAIRLSIRPSIRLSGGLSSGHSRMLSMCVLAPAKPVGSQDCLSTASRI